MRQFDVCRLKGRDQLIVVLQHDIADELASRIVAPLSVAPPRKPIDRIRVPIELNGDRYVVQLDRLAAIEKSAIGAVLGNVGDADSQIKNGVDLLIFGV